MKNTKSFILLFTPIILITLLALNVYAQHKKHDHNAVMKQDTASVIEQYKNVKDKEVREYMTNLHLDMIDKTKPTYKTWNTVCPVLGRPVNPKLKPIVYKEKAYGFCCKVCPPKFQDNPEKYIKNLDKTGKKFSGKAV
ncbi:MAG: hypothetical protein FD143_81 [Ignavibacteria bacterium]|nr:MAG: hypothetical protein FD143_81 [Ignavibacteria bacterium]KAF0162504.1 MAG: hypothetical protein FD188_107 [Ignavibacteria bacterium]